NEIGVAEIGLDRAQPASAAEPHGEPASTHSAGADADCPAVPDLTPDGQLPLQVQLEALEQQRILEALERCGGNQSEAARRLGMSSSTLIARLDRYRAPRPRKSVTAR